MAGKGGSKPGPRVEPVLTNILPAGAIPMPSKPNNRGSKSAYPFDQLTAPGMSFGVRNKTVEQLGSIVSNMNRKPGKPKVDSNGAPMFEMVDMIGADNRPTGSKVADTTKPLYELGPQFFVVEPTADDPDNIDPATKKKLPAEKCIKARIFRQS